eukprot:363049-Chlamydomonas_euryale.AAC.15
MPINRPCALNGKSSSEKPWIHKHFANTFTWSCPYDLVTPEGFCVPAPLRTAWADFEVARETARLGLLPAIRP